MKKQILFCVFLYLFVFANVVNHCSYVVKTKGQSLLKDGTYIGEYTKWPEMKVEVTLTNGRISVVKVLEDKGTLTISNRVTEELPKKMIAQGSVDVDGISGATLSSNSLKEAVRKALEQAK